MAQHESIRGTKIVNENGNGTKVTHSSPNTVHLCGPDTLWLFILCSLPVSLLEQLHAHSPGAVH